MQTSPNPKAELLAAIELAGGITALAKAIGAQKGAVWAWTNRGKCPPEWCIAVETAVGGRVTRHQLRPDVFGPAPGVTPTPTEARAA